MTASCPFCASERTEIIEADLDGWAVECRDCKTTGPIAKSRELAELRWNERILYSEMRNCG